MYFIVKLFAIDFNPKIACNFVKLFTVYSRSIIIYNVQSVSEKIDIIWNERVFYKHWYYFII